MLAFFSIAPGDRAGGMSELVAGTLQLVEESGLPYRFGPMGTTVEGDWDEVMDLIGRAHKLMAEKSARISTLIKIDDRIGATNRLDGKMEAVEGQLGRKLRR